MQRHDFIRLVGAAALTTPFVAGAQSSYLDYPVTLIVPYTLGGGNDVPRGEEGEIACDGPSVHLGYYNNPQANAEAFTADGWFRTGDLGVIADDAGNVRIVGRSKEIINRGGKKFSPREVEEILYAHPKVLHVAMVGVADARLGECNCLCVVPKGGAQVTLEEFSDLLRGQVATYKLPERLEIFSELPFTPTGKIQRFLLQKEIETRDRAARRRDTSVTA